MENIKKQTHDTLKSFDPGISELKTDKHTYKVITKTMSHDRYMALEMWQLIFATYQSRMNHTTYQQELQKAFNKQDYALLGKLIIDGQMVLDLKGQGVHPVMMLCATFVVKEDEDVQIWNEDQAREKINDWLNYGYDITSFFYLSLRVCPTLKEGYKVSTQSILAEIKDRTIPKQ